MVLLESLTPAERAAYLLHEVFEYSHAEVAHMLGREETSCRQLVHRARQRVLTGKPRFSPSRQAHRRLLDGFRLACMSGNIAALESLLAEDVRAWSDGGGKALAARKPLHGRRAVARLYGGIFRHASRECR
jgi:RNA polymerase sigma-70 factor (ECF subfamily)